MDNKKDEKFDIKKYTLDRYELPNGDDGHMRKSTIGESKSLSWQRELEEYWEEQRKEKENAEE